MELDQSAAFEVHGENGQVWRIYADGRITGFPEGKQLVVNRIPSLLAEQSFNEPSIAS